MNTIETLFWKVAIWILRRGYGADCETSDLDDFHEMYSNAPLSESIAHGGRCGSCKAKETIAFIKNHIELINS